MTTLVLRVLLPALLGLACAQGVVFAYVTDDSVYRPVDYAVLQPPAAGASYLDPAFGTPIKRLSDALAWADHAGSGPLTLITNEYATMSPVNSDNSRILVQHRSYFALYDSSGNYLRDLPLEIAAPSEPRWSQSDPNLIYYHTVSGNQLKQYDVGGGASTVVHAFAEYATIAGLGESDISADGDHVVLVGDHRYVFVYQISTDTKGPVLDTSGFGGFDNVHITPDNNVLISWHATGTGRFQGIELYDGSMNFLRQVSRASGHMDVTRDTDGAEVAVWINAADPWAICPNGIVKVRLEDGRQTCLLSLDWSLAAHVSAPDGNGWVLISTYATSDLDPLVGWRLYTNEIFELKLDGSEIRRLLQHRSRPANSYHFTPRASVSRDGRKMVYSSNFGLQAILGAPSQYSDAYFIDLGAATPASAGSVNSIAMRFEQDSPAVAYACPSYSTWHMNTYALHSGGSAAMAMNVECQATFSFTGSAVSWIGHRDQWSGIALVYVDGALAATMDTYAATAQPQAVLFSMNGLGPGPHTLTIQATETANAASAGPWVWIDAFDVIARVEQDDSAVAYACPSYSTWYTNTYALHSGGNAALAMNLACRATFSFTGSAVSWIGHRDQWSGIANVYLDGALRAEVDTYAPAGDTQARLFTLSSLAPGPHTLTIEASGRLNQASAGAWIWVDAFEVHP
jgi:hypothetical protein